MTLTLILWLLSAGQSLAGLSAINGTVKDPTGSLVPGAQITVTNPVNGITRQLSTNDSGYFLAPSLPPGSGYQVGVSKEGFGLFEAKDVVLQVGQNVTLIVDLTVDQATSEVYVTEAVSVVEP